MADVTKIPGIQSLWEKTSGDSEICVAVLDGLVDQAAIIDISQKACQGQAGCLPHKNYGRCLIEIELSKYTGKKVVVMVLNAATFDKAKENWGVFAAYKASLGFVSGFKFV